MKKVFPILLIPLFLSSCLAVKAPVVYTGMRIEQFLKAAKHEELVDMQGDYAVYRVQYGFSGQETRFYYFRNGILQGINEGERAVDLRVKIDND